MRERRHDFIDLSSDQLDEIIRPVFPVLQIVSAELIRNGLVNANYKLSVSGHETPFLLRIYVRDPAACPREAKILGLAGTI